MPIRDDFLMRQIAALAALVARLVGRKQVDEAELDEAVRGTLGLDLKTVGGLSGGTLRMLLAGDDADAIERRALLADLIEARGDAAKAAELRG